ncbi:MULTISPECIES: hypothetical protein [Streptomyces]|uniref:GerMN domain-containing protein n=2 Tax=Streptomyces TaxID=1883 RepID=A0ABU4KKJ1_9ACTN|nr:hypothetical protein [Streptomyces roseolus]MDX2297895.1 hypothetical protein [Streptomyces roseolus]
MRRRAGLAALLAAALPLLGGCGIQGSDVVEAGEAPTVNVQPVPEGRMLLYFLGPDGELMPVARDVGLSFVPVPETTHPGSEQGSEPDHIARREIDLSHPNVRGLATVKVLSALLAGPGGAELQAGLTTELPASREPIRVESEDAGGIRLQTPYLVQELSERAVAQLVCTAAFAVDRAGAREVTVAGPDGTLPPTACEP